MCEFVLPGKKTLEYLFVLRVIIELSLISPVVLEDGTVIGLNGESKM